MNRTGNIREEEMATDLEIAVIGMAARLPGARNIDRFWENLKNGIESFTFFSEQELEEAGVSGKLLENPKFVKTQGGGLEDKEYFDAPFFGYTPQEAGLLNPQVRIFYECTWEALENAAYNPFVGDYLIGIYAGAADGFNWKAMTILSGKNNIFGEFATSLLTDEDNLCTRVSYHLNLKGPAVAVQSYCSTSLVAIHMACQALLNGECDIALAGGITVTTNKDYGYVYQEGLIHSPDGHCRAFDAKSKGIAAGEGVGVVVLKQLEHAIEEGDHIYAVVKGTAINNDGIRKVGYTAPSVVGQAEVIQLAQQVADVHSESISYIETHGTGTPLGDPVEIRALTQAFNTTKQGYCAIGSVKSNIGHVDRAAGVAGFIKTVLALKNKLIPPSLHFETPNPEIDFENSPFYVNTTLSKWKNDTYPLRAGVSSFGIGGTNAHVILEQAPARIRDKEGTRGLVPLFNAETSRKYQLILLSARTQSALDTMTKNFAAYLKKNPRVNLPDVAYTLQVGRREFKHRKMLVCSTVQQAIQTLSTGEPGKTHSSFLKEEIEDRPIVFMFPGLGAQYTNMGRELNQKEPIFREEMNRCFEILKPLLGYDIKEILYPGRGEVSSPSGEPPATCHLHLSPDINQFEVAQLVIFMVEYALAKLLTAWGITPTAMIGYSFGEYVAACISGVFSLEDALKLVVWRGRLIKEIPGGAMLSVPLPAGELKSLLGNELSIAIDNGPSCIVAGPNQAVNAFEKQMIEKRYLCMRLPVSHALHSTMMAPILKTYEEKVSHLVLNKPQIPYISNVTAKWMTTQDAADPGYWSRHLRETVHFDKGIKELLNGTAPGTIFLEIGPGRDISTLVKRCPDNNSSQKIINLIRYPEKKAADTWYLYNKIGQLWLYGKTIDWEGFYSQEKRYRIPLPAYSFERLWFTSVGSINKLIVDKFSGIDRLEHARTLADWFYIPSWKRIPVRMSSSPVKPGKMPTGSCWLVFIDACGLGLQLVKHLEKNGQVVAAVKIGVTFQKERERQYVVNPGQVNDYDELFNEMIRQDIVPRQIIHFWGVSNKTNETSSSGSETFSGEQVTRAQELGFYSLVTIAQIIGKRGIKNDIRITVITNNMHEVTGEEELCPEKATVLGPVKVISTEYSNIHCRSIDVVLPGQSSRRNLQEEKLINRLIEELTLTQSSNALSWEPVMALRGNHRWMQVFEPLRFEKSHKKPVLLKEGGVYLVTGGLGGIGMALAEYLAKQVRARLVLTGRTRLPARSQWDRWLTGSNKDKDHDLGDRIRKVKALEELGCEVMVFSADVSNREQMQAVIARVEEHFGPVNGVIHCAGLPDGQMIQRRKPGMLEHILVPKLLGTLVLDHLLENAEPDFFILCSSLNSILPAFGQVAYCAANAFLDAFALHKNSKNNRLTISIDWDRWKNVGIAAIAEDMHKKLTGNDLEGGITVEQGVEVFERILAEPMPRVAVSRDDLARSIELAKNRNVSSLAKEFDDMTVSRTMHQRPELDAQYIVPGSDTEKILAGIWENFFGYNQVGIQDDFFELGGDSLKAIVMISSIYKALNVTIPLPEFFNRPTIGKLAEYIGGAEKSIYSSIEPTEKKEYYPLSPAQKRMFILYQMETANISYNMAFTIVLAGDIHKERMEETSRKLIQRHENFRTSFEMVDAAPVQRVHQEVPFKIVYFEQQEEEADEIITSFTKPFDLSQAPLLKVGLIKTGQSRHILMVDMHHIISDSVSLEILKKDFTVLLEKGDLPRLRLHYKDYSQWQDSEKQKKAVLRQKEYWLKLFAKQAPLLNLPLDYPRPGVQDFRGDKLFFNIGKENYLELKEFAHEKQVTLYTVCLAIFNVLLYKLSGQEDLVVGTDTAGRRHADLQNVIGMFVNTLALRNYPGPAQTFVTFLQEINKRTLEAFENQDYPFEELVEQVVVQRDLSRNPLFDAAFFFFYAEKRNPVDKSKAAAAPGLIQKPYQKEHKSSMFDLSLEVRETEDNLFFNFEYCTKLFKKEKIENFAILFKEILSSILENPQIILGETKISLQLLAVKKEEVGLDELDF